MKAVFVMCSSSSFCDAPAAADRQHRTLCQCRETYRTRCGVDNRLLTGSWNHLSLAVGEVGVRVIAIFDIREVRRALHVLLGGATGNFVLRGFVSGETSWG